MSNKVCPNPNGEEGICYSFDRFGGREGCVGCKLLNTLPNGMFNEGDPLPGLTKQIAIKELFSKIAACSQYEHDLELWPGLMTINKEDCKMILDLIDATKAGIDEVIKIVEEGILDVEHMIEFYKEDGESCASEIHILTTRVIHLNTILDKLKNIATSPDMVYNIIKEVEKMKNPKCCLCGKECENQFGNNPWPLSKEVKDRCCNKCNDEKVIPARILQSISKKEEKTCN